MFYNGIVTLTITMDIFSMSQATAIRFAGEVNGFCYLTADTKCSRGEEPKRSPKILKPVRYTRFNFLYSTSPLRLHAGPCKHLTH